MLLKGSTENRLRKLDFLVKIIVWGGVGWGNNSDVLEL